MGAIVAEARRGQLPHVGAGVVRQNRLRQIALELGERVVEGVGGLGVERVGAFRQPTHIGFAHVAEHHGG